MTRPVFALAVFSLLLVAACNGGSGKTQSNDPYAGLSPEILKWRAELEASHPACKSKIEGKGCEGFEVTCKGARDLTPADQAKGVSAKVVASMRFSGRMPDGSTGKLGSGFAEFDKTGAGWVRNDTAPVNPTTCASLS